MVSVKELTVLLIGFPVEDVLTIEDMLSPSYKLQTLETFKLVLSTLTDQKIDLVLLNFAANNFACFDLIQQIREQFSSSDLPLLCLSDHVSEADESYALSVGANDFINKPFSPAVVLSRLHTHLQLSVAQKRLRLQNNHLQDVVELKTQEMLAQSERLVEASQQLSQAQAATITAICSLAEVRDSETGNHILRTQHYVKILARHLMATDKYQAQLNPKMIDILFQCAPLHDIGKLVIPDKILLKPSRLNDTEWEVMKRHTEFGFKAIHEAAKKLDLSDGVFLKTAADIAYSHHEKWDGNGYPQGLKGVAIPLSARLMAVADVYDALICKRVYKRPYSHDEAIAIMKEGRGVHFDPDIIDALLQLQREFLEISRKFPD